MIKPILIQNGLNEKEASVYLATLEAGEIPISQIASKAKIKRSTVYHVIDNLKVKGILTSQKRKGIQYISALSPQILVDRFKKSAAMADEILPELLNMAYASPLKPRIRFFEGKEGIKHVLREFSYSKEQSMGFTDYEQMPKDLFEFIRSEVIPERKKQKNCARLIIPNNPVNRKIKAEDNVQFTEHRIANFPSKNNPMELLLFGKSSLAFLSFAKEEMFGVIIDSPAIYKTIQNIFSLIWNNAA